ncbi:MAG: translocation/assembly module TamB domain-containing protein [Myxococcales bacterium]|jgi:hypothetical protein
MGKLGKRLRLGLALLVGLPIVVLLLALGALLISPLRKAAVDEALKSVNQSIAGDLQAEDARLSSPGTLELDGVTLRDAKGRQVGRVEHAEVSFDPGGLLSDPLVIDAIEVQGADVELGELTTMQGGLLDALASTEAVPRPVQDAAEAATGVRLQRVCVDRSRVGGTLDGARVELSQLHACARVEVAAGFEVQVLELRALLKRERAAVARLVDPGALSAPGSPPAAGDGDGPARLSLRGTIAGDDADISLDAELKARGVDGRTLGRAGVPDVPLAAPADLELGVEGPLSALRYDVRVFAAGGRARLDGALTQPGGTALSLDVKSLPLGVVLGEEGVDAITAKADASLGWARHDGALAARVDLASARYGELDLPAVQASALVEESGAVRIERLVARSGTARVEVDGRVGEDGAVSLQGTARAVELAQVPIVSRKVPLLSGALSSRLSLHRSATGRLDVEVDATLQRLQLGTRGAARVELRADLDDVAARPRGEVTLDAAAVQVDGRALGAVRLSLRGGPERYDLEGQSTRGDLQVAGQLERTSGGVSGQLDAAARTPVGRLSARVARAELRDGRILELSGVRLALAGAEARVDGRLDLEGDGSQLRVSVRVPDVARSAGSLLDEPPPGRLTARGELAGALQAPQIEVDLQYAIGTTPVGLRAEMHLEADLPQRKLLSTLTVRAGKAGRVRAELQSSLASREASVEALTRGRHALTLEAAETSLRALLSALPQPQPMPALLDDVYLESLQLVASGTRRDHQVELQTDARVHPAGGEPAVDLSISSVLNEGTLQAQVDAEDARGALLSLDGQVELGRDPLGPRAPPLSDLAHRVRWELGLTLSSRRLPDLPWARHHGVGGELLPMQVEASGRLQHEPGRGPEGALEVISRWSPTRGEPARTAGCAKGPARLDLRLDSSGDGLRLGLRGYMAHGQVLSAEAWSPVSAARWLAGDKQRVGPVQVALDLQDVDTSALPVLCEQAGGTLAGTVEGRDLFDGAAALNAQLELRDFHWGDGPSFDARLQVTSLKDALQVDAEVLPGDGRAEISGQLPISVQVDDPALCVHEQRELAVTARFDHVAVQPLLSLVPAVARPSGHVDGELALSGSIAEPRGRGQLHLDEVSLTLPQAGLRFDRIDADARLEDRTLYLQRARIEDRRGWAEISARVSLLSRDRWEGELDLQTDDFPLRNSGIYVGQADSQAHVEARGDEQGLEVHARIDALSVQLVSSDLGGVQPLDPNPDISFVDDPDAAVEVDPEEDPGEGKVAIIRVRTERPVWVRRDDFSIQMNADLTIRRDPGGASVAGKIELRRGFLLLLGQRFDVDRGEIEFTGGESVDPRLEIEASQAGAARDVQVRVTGSVQSPELTFLMGGQVVTAGEAVRAMTGRAGRGTGDDEASARAQLSSAAVGMTAGLLSLGVRRELGEWVPMLSVSQAQEGTRIGAGISAYRIIPEFLRDLVVDAYVEGIVSTGQDDDGTASANGASGGVLLELVFPHDLVWAGQYGPGPRWSVDLDWRP